MNKIYPLFFLLTFLLTFSFSTPARANSFHTMGHLGYESVDVKHGDLKFEHSGVNLGVGLQYAFLEIPEIELLAGAGLKYSWLTGDATLVGVKSTAEISQPMISIEAGVGKSAISPALNFQGTIGYDFGFLGVNTVKTSGETQSEDLKKFGRATFNGRAFYRTVPTLDFGIQYSYLVGTLRAESGETLETTGYTLALTLRSVMN